MTDETLDLVTDEAKELITSDSLKKNYSKILLELDAIYKGVFDEDEAERFAALALLSQAALIKALAGAEQRARGLKRDVEFAKAEAYANIKSSSQKEDGKKLTETALAQLVVKDGEVNKIQDQFNVAEREAKELSNLLGVLKDSHLLFRAVVKKNKEV